MGYNVQVLILGLLLVTSGLSYSAYSQSKNQISFNDEISLQFPCEPDKKTMREKDQMYTCKSDGCGFLAADMSNVINDYEKYRQLSKKEQVAFADSLIGDFVAGKLSVRNKSLISQTTSSFAGKNVGWDIVYTEPDPTNLVNPDPRKRFATIIIIGTTLYTIECWYLDDRDHTIERDKFFKSIFLKDN